MLETSSKSTSPQSLPVSRRLIPTSITIAPFWPNRLWPFWRPTAGHQKYQLVLQISGRSAVLECAVVTVALAASRSCAIGLPNKSERPITTACFSRQVGADFFDEHHRALRRTGYKAVQTATSLPILGMVSPSTSLSGEMVWLACPSPNRPAKEVVINTVNFRVGVERLIRPLISDLFALAGRRVPVTWFQLWRRLWLCWQRKYGWRGCRPPKPQLDRAGRHGCCFRGYFG